MEIIKKKETIKSDLPNATLIFGLGILAISIVFYSNIIGIVLSIATLVISAKSKRIFKYNPEQFEYSSYKRIVVGRIFAIIALIISIFAFIFSILVILGVLGLVGIVSITDLFI